jgi:DNA-binding XRE family transcriptional regulator
MPETPSVTIRPLPELDETRTPQLLPMELRARTAELRDQAIRISDQAQELHTQVQLADLERRATILAQQDLSDLLSAACDEYGMSWNTLAQLVGVTPTAVRKWRKGQAITPEKRRRLALAIAFCRALSDVNPRITDPALWLEMPLHQATTLTGAVLFADGYADLLLDVAAERLEAASALDIYDADWRVRYAADDSHVVVTADDGLPAIVPRTRA